MSKAGGAIRRPTGGAVPLADSSFVRRAAIRFNCPEPQQFSASSARWSPAVWLPRTCRAVTALLIILLVWLGSGVLALVVLLTVSRRAVHAPGPATPSFE